MVQDTLCSVSCLGIKHQMLPDFVDFSQISLVSARDNNFNVKNQVRNCYPRF